MQQGNNPPVGIILCPGKDEALVKYATAGLSQQVFVSTYMINLPSEKELRSIITEEQGKYFKRQNVSTFFYCEIAFFSSFAGLVAIVGENSRL